MVFFGWSGLQVQTYSSNSASKDNYITVLVKLSWFSFVYSFLFVLLITAQCLARESGLGRCLLTDALHQGALQYRLVMLVDSLAHSVLAILCGAELLGQHYSAACESCFPLFWKYLKITAR